MVFTTILTERLARRELAAGEWVDDVIFALLASEWRR
jgi:RimJ/RimL family protein N-acetyltransferase